MPRKAAPRTTRAPRAPRTATARDLTPEAATLPFVQPSLSSDVAGLINRDEIAAVRTALLAWYRRGHRDLPWRRRSDAYAIWISEIMLQQTRVDTVREYFRRFMERFPTISDLAAAPQAEVLAMWSGLGYYARARNLHAAAKAVAERHGGVFPSAPDDIAALPGIGPYTAGAIRSIAFGQQAPILDGNVFRVISRILALTDAPDSTAGKRRLWALAEALVPPRSATFPGENDAGDFNQALMELGATVCVPQRPVCLVCPLADRCQGRRLGDPERYPGKKAIRAVPEVRAVCLVLRDPAGQILLLERPPSGLWGGLWEPATAELYADESEADGLVRIVTDKLRAHALVPALPAAQPLPPFTHQLTHRTMHFSPYLLDCAEAPALRPLVYTRSRWTDPRGPLALALSAWVTALVARLISLHRLVDEPARP